MNELKTILNEPFYKQISKAYKEEIDSIDDMVSTQLITPNRGRTFKKNLKAKYSLLLDSIKDTKTQEEADRKFSDEKEIYDMMQWLCEIWRYDGRKKALSMLSEFYEDDEKHHGKVKEKPLIWKRTVEKMAEEERHNRGKKG